MTGAARRLGYRLFGSAFDYILHLRPAEWPIMAGHTALGWLLATGGRVPDGSALLGLFACRNDPSGPSQASVSLTVLAHSA